MKQNLHSICRWTFNPGKGGFVPGDMRPEWAWDLLDSAKLVDFIAAKLKPRLPEHILLGYELHYDTEINDNNASAIADALVRNEIPLAMITPGAHAHFAYGGISSLDPKERDAARALGNRTLDLAYGEMRRSWHKEIVPTFVLWNGSWGYDMVSPSVKEMYQTLKESVAGLCKEEEKRGGLLPIGIEPKPNEGHPTLLLPTTGSVIVFWHKLASEFGISLKNKGTNKEIGHSEMIGLDPVFDTMEELDNDMVMHVHLNSQGYNDGLIHGGPGKYDIDHGTRINGFNIAMARLYIDAGYSRWYGHDMQARAYDSEEQGIDRVVRSILSWEACLTAAENLDMKVLAGFMQNRETAKAEDLMRTAVMSAYKTFDELYGRTPVGSR